MAQNFSVTLEKIAGRTLTESKVKEQLQAILDRVMAGNRQQRGWSAKIDRVQLIPKEQIQYLAYMSLVCDPKTPRTTIDAEFDNIVAIIKSAGNIPKWRVISINGKTTGDKSLSDKGVTIGYAAVDIPKDWRKNFEHIFERDPQIEIIQSAIEAAIKSKWRHRFHVALFGEPASGKTEISRSVKAMLGDEAVLEYDATATTQAGAIKDLNERDELPRVIIVEELEKADEASLRWLLGVLDIRAEVRKLTARSAVLRDTKMLCIATVNDHTLFTKLMFGALASRFAYHVWCPRPDRKLMERILSREVEVVGGDKRWIKPALDYAEKLGVNDPRQVTAICLCGKDDLLTGKFQLKLEKVRKPVGKDDTHSEK